MYLESQRIHFREHYPDLIKNNGVGTQLQVLAWAHANPIVVEHISLMVTMSDAQQQYVDLNVRDRLSVADAVVLEHRLGLTKAAAFISAVDPWSYPHDDTPALLNVKSYVQSVVAQAANAGKRLLNFTTASMSDFLLSPLLIKKGDRPPLGVKPKAAQRTTSPKLVITAAATVSRKPCPPSIEPPIDRGGPHMICNRPPDFPSLSLSLNLHVSNQG